MVIKQQVITKNGLEGEIISDMKPFPLNRLCKIPLYFSLKHFLSRSSHCLLSLTKETSFLPRDVSTYPGLQDFPAETFKS